MHPAKAHRPACLRQLQVHPLAAEPWTYINDFTHRGDQGAILLRLAAICYLLGVLGVTAARNVPLNTMLGGMDLAVDSTRQFWIARYVPDWTFWNTVRTLGSIASSVLCLSGLILLIQA